MEFFFSGNFCTLRNAIKKFWYLVDVKNFTVDESASACWDSYPNIHLVPYKKWSPTKGNPTDRRGPVPPPFKMTRKPGPKPKMNQKLTEIAKQSILRRPKASNPSVAQHLQK